MFTVDFFLGLADNAREEMRLLREKPELMSRSYLELDRLAMTAQACSEYMTRESIAAAPIMGPFGMIPFKAGDRVLIKKGARIHSTRTFGVLTAKRRYPVTVHRINYGYVQAVSKLCVIQPEVVWAGSGGYWTWTRVDAVERIIA